MKPAEVEGLFAELKFACDVRRPPDDARARQFRTGWEDATVRHANYGEATLTRLTWRNLGYRFGEHQGLQRLEAIDAVYRILGAAYTWLWVPRSHEDHLLQKYWRRAGGRLYVEVRSVRQVDVGTGRSVRLGAALMPSDLWMLPIQQSFAFLRASFVRAWNHRPSSSSKPSRLSTALRLARSSRGGICSDVTTASASSARWSSVVQPTAPSNGYVVNRTSRWRSLASLRNCTAGGHVSNFAAERTAGSHFARRGRSPRRCGTSKALAGTVLRERH